MRQFGTAAHPRRGAGLCVGMLLAIACIGSVSAGGGARKPALGTEEGQWRSYAGDPQSRKYSPLDQIHRDNVRRLRVAWTWDSPDNALQGQNPAVRPGPNEGTPLMVEGTLYVPTGTHQVCAIDAASGKTRWTFDPRAGGNVHRGLAYWSDGSQRRLFLPTRDSYLYALDPETGRPIPGFGENGRVDLASGMRRTFDRGLMSYTSPPSVCGNVIVVGSAVDDFQERREMPPGDVRGYDARTGRLLWTFHTVPQAGEFGNETWKEGSWRYTGNTNVWTWMSYDPELDYIYLPVSTPTNDWYGGHRPGDGLYGESIVCLQARTGRRVWHYQFVHHGLWDYDPPCAPVLFDVKQNGKTVRAVAQVTKQAFCFVFDRVSGRPLWPIEERRVPTRVMPGDQASPTQPFPTKPKPFDRQGLKESDLIDFTPQLRREAKALLKDWHYGPLYTPPLDRRSILMPGWVGGASWAGACVDPETGMLYVSSITNAMWLKLEKPRTPGADVNWKIGENGHVVPGPRGLPLTKPPYGRITAIDMRSGDHRWMTPLGDGPRHHPELKHLKLGPLGLHRRGFLLATKTLLFAIQEGSWFNSEEPTEPASLRAFDKATGKLLATVPLPSHATGAPITYMAGGKQWICVPTGGGKDPQRLFAVALP